MGTGRTQGCDLITDTETRDIQPFTLAIRIIT